jgi:hypothetical protein
MHEQLFLEQLFLPVTDHTPGPLTSDDIGFTVHYADGNIYRYENSIYKRAAEIRPNLADPAQQWVNLIQRGGQKLVQEFLMMFPWHKDLFTRCQTKLDDLMAILVENYKELNTRGWRNVRVPARHVAYMRDLMEEVNALDDIYTHFMNEDAKRVYYLINPYDVRVHHRYARTTVPVPQ